MWLCLPVYMITWGWKWDFITLDPSQFDRRLEIMVFKDEGEPTGYWLTDGEDITHLDDLDAWLHEYELILNEACWSLRSSKRRDPGPYPHEAYSHEAYE